ncbi:hypothetical protein Tco_0428603 [Tanacetum coccineum]
MKMEILLEPKSNKLLDHLKMEMEMEIPSSSNVKLITECSDTTYTCYEAMKDLIKVSKLPQTLISYSSSQFWSTVNVKTINRESQLHARVDGKKIIITESTIRRDLQLVDKEGVDCLLNSTIFEQLVLMGSKTIAWNEFSSTMASTIICLATNQKFNFSKFIFESMVNNLDNLSGKFLIYPRFVQVFLEQQLDDLSTHESIYISLSHTKKIFANMRRADKGFSSRVTPLFLTMVVQNQSKLGEGSANPTDPHHTPTIIQLSTQPQKTQKPRKPKRKDTQVPQPSGPSDNVADEAVHKELGDSLVRAATTASSLEVEQDSGNINKTQSKETPYESSSHGISSGGGPRCQETMRDTITQTSLRRRVKKLEQKKRSRTHGLKRLRKVGATSRIESSGDEESLGEDASKHGRIDVIDTDEAITLLIFDVAQVSAAGDKVSTANATTTVSIATTTTADDLTLAQAL